ncbi:MAG: DUF4350 domain-containing protein, partial [Gemmatimonadales bacterium]
MSHRLEIGLALLLATAIGVAVWAANRSAKPPAPDTRASTFLSGPNGSKAVYDVLVRLGRPVERRRTALFRLNEDTTGRDPPALLVFANPPIPLEDAELAAVIAYVHAGGDVLAAGWGAGMTRCVGWRVAPDRVQDDSVAVRAPRWAPANARLPKAAR